MRAYDGFKDDSDLGLVMGVYIKLPHTKLLWMGAYWPVSAPPVDLKDLTPSGRLAHRTKVFFTTKGYGTTIALEYVKESLATSRPVIKTAPWVPCGSVWRL